MYKKGKDIFKMECTKKQRILLEKINEVNLDILKCEKEDKPESCIRLLREKKF